MEEKNNFVDTEIYKKYETSTMPLFYKNARRISMIIPWVDYDDVLQEGKIALYSALSIYNKEKSIANNARPLINKVVINRYRNIVKAAYKKSRMPRVKIVDDNGVITEKMAYPISVDTMFVNDEQHSYEPVSNYINQEENSECVEIKIELEALIETARNVVINNDMYNNNDCSVFHCMVKPTQEFLKFLYKRGSDYVAIKNGSYIAYDDFFATNSEIRDFLGITRNKVGYSIKKIRKLFATLISKERPDMCVATNWSKKWLQE